jgi:hypothetical protein
VRRGLAIYLAAVLTAAVGATCASAHLSVESADESGVRFIVDLPDVEDVVDAGGRWAGARIPGFVNLFDESLGIHVPVNAYLIAAPHGSHVTCEVDDALHYKIVDYRTPDLARLLGSRFDEMPRRAAEITTDGHLGHQRVVGIRIAPIVYDEVKGGLRIYRRLTVSIEFAGGDRPEAVPGRNATAVGGTEARYRSALLNYEQGKQWRRALAAPDKQGDYFSDAPVWVKVKLDTSGIFCITGSDLEVAGIDIAGIQASSVRLYGGGGLPLTESLAESNPTWMEQVPIKISDGGDGLFGRNDSILFFGLGARDWADLYDRARPKIAYYKSFYSNHNYYWLTWGGAFAAPAKHMETKQTPACEGCVYYEPQSVTTRLHMEADVFENFSVRAEDGWYWQPLRTDSRIDIQVHTPSSDATVPAVVRVRVADWASGRECDNYYYRVILRINNTAVQDTVWEHERTFRNVVDIWGAGVPAGPGQQTIRIEAPSALPPPYTGRGVCKKLDLAWCEVFYRRLLEGAGDGLFFSAPDTTGTVRYDIGGFAASGLYAFEIIDQFEVRQLSGIEISASAPYGAAFFDTVSKSTKRHYALVTPEAMLKPVELAESDVAAEAVRYSSTKSYCVIAHEDLVGAAAEIADFHAGRSVGGVPITSEVVTVQQIYDEFGWGVPDVTAIRDFLRWRYQNGQLAWVLLLGDATWDYKGYGKSSAYPNYVSTYERRYMRRWLEPYNTDDWMAYLEAESASGDSTARWPAVAISRLPASSPEEAADLVARTIAYLGNPEIGRWQNRIILIADDDRTPSGCDAITHTTYAEDLSDEGYPPSVEQVKIYLYEYPRESTGLKPEAKDAFIENLNRGALITNFVGHGDEQRWCQEEVYNPAAKDLVNNGRMRTFLIAASCNVSRFDEPNKSSAGEDLLRRSEGGTIGSLASTHLCQAPANQSLNLFFIRHLFQPGFKDSTLFIGDAVTIAKILAVTASGLDTYSRNNEMYALFGDPLLELAIPRLDVVFTSAGPDTLSRKGAYRLSAGVYDGDEPAGWAQGSAEIWMGEAEDTTGYVDCNGRFIDYELAGSEIFRTRSPVLEDTLGFRFFVASGAREGRRARIGCFASSGLNTASGVIDSVSIYGEEYSDDDVGPQIEILSGGKVVDDGDTLVAGSSVDIRMHDDSGVAVKGKSEFIPSVSIAFDEFERIDLSDGVYAVDGDFTTSSVSFEVPQLTAGVHTLSVAAFDNLNNLTSSDYQVFVGGETVPASGLAYIYPNPLNDVCYIVWDYEHDGVVEVEATIYTVSGRKIWSDSASSSDTGEQVQIRWDGRDVVGDLVANGTYLVIVEALSPEDPDFGTTDRVILSIIR